MRMSTHSRLLKDVLTHYKTTFAALKELITNSLQAKSNKIEINLIPSACDKDSVFYHIIDSIEIKDNGHGIPVNKFQNTIMKIATDNKEGGLGIGRFGALQIGKKMTIETVGFDLDNKKYTKSSVVIDAFSINQNDLQDVEFDVTTSDIEDTNVDTYYKVNITDLYHNAPEPSKKNLLSQEFHNINDFKQSIFESYPFQVFEGKVHFYVNGEALKKESFCIDAPKHIFKTLTDQKGIDHTINLYLYKVNLKEKDINVFFQVNNAGVKTSVARYQYLSPWYTSDAGAWYIFVDSDIITRDSMSNFDLADLGDYEAKAISEIVREAIDEFFKKSNIKFTSFIDKLTKDPSYPYKIVNKNERPTLEVNVFNHTAYLLEMEQRLIETGNSARKTIYPIVKKVIEDGDTEFLVENVIQLSKDSRHKFCELIEATKLDDIISFTSSVAKHTQFLDFLYELCYGETSKWLKERKQLHKIVEKELWLFGEEYNESTRLWSDKKLENNLNELHTKHLSYTPTAEDENLIEEAQVYDKDITDLFFYNKKKLGNGREEVIIVELKAPSCAIAEKEISQIERYRRDIIESSAFPKEKVYYKIILISSKLSNGAKIKTQSARKYNDESDPFLYSTYQENGAYINLYIMEWSELISYNRKKLSYLSNSLEVKEEDVNEKFMKEYPELIDEKSRNRLNKRELE